jgi:hypothetical protein
MNPDKKVGGISLGVPVTRWGNNDTVVKQRVVPHMYIYVRPATCLIKKVQGPISVK